MFPRPKKLQPPWPPEPSRLTLTSRLLPWLWPLPGRLFYPIWSPKSPQLRAVREALDPGSRTESKGEKREPWGKGKGRRLQGRREVQAAPNKASACHMGTGLTLTAKVLPCATGLRRGLRVWGSGFKSFIPPGITWASSCRSLGLSFPIGKMGECNDGRCVGAKSMCLHPVASCHWNTQVSGVRAPRPQPFPRPTLIPQVRGLLWLAPSLGGFLEDQAGAAVSLDPQPTQGGPVPFYLTVLRV